MGRWKRARKKSSKSVSTAHKRSKRKHRPPPKTPFDQVDEDRTWSCYAIWIPKARRGKGKVYVGCDLKPLTRVKEHRGTNVGGARGSKYKDEEGRLVADPDARLMWIVTGAFLNRVDVLKFENSGIRHSRTGNLLPNPTCEFVMKALSDPEHKWTKNGTQPTVPVWDPIRHHLGNYQVFWFKDLPCKKFNPRHQSVTSTFVDQHFDCDEEMVAKYYKDKRLASL